jgi:hypothetical protein
MDILTDYRITALTVREHELSIAAERARVAAERASEVAPQRTLTTGPVRIPAAAH